MKKRLTGYIAYGILITIVFLYCRFPDPLIEQGIRSAIAKSNPDVVVSLDSATLSFPLTVEIKDLTIGEAGRPGSVVVDHLKADFAFTQLLRGIVSCTLEGDAYGGFIVGDAGFTERFSIEGPISLNARLNAIDIGACSYLKRTLNQNINGRLTGTVSYRGSMKDAINGSGDADLTLLEGSMGLRQPLLGQRTLDFDTLTVRAVLRDRSLKINKGEIAGKLMSGSFGGVIFLNNTILRSRIAVKGRARMLPLEKDVSVTLSGTLDRMRHRIR